MIAQLIIIALGFISLGVHIAKHKKPRKELEYNGWERLVGTIIFWIILYYGGFWDVILNN